MVRASDTVDIEGPVGRVQTLVDEPEVVRGLALVAHPHPLFGGNNANKVVYTLAHCLRDLGYLALRPNFRGVGRSDGTYDHGRGETDDLLAVLDHAVRRWGDAGPLPVVLAGFSFGAFVQTKVTRRLSEAGRPAARLVLVALATGPVPDTVALSADAVPRDTILIHGDRDTTVPLANVLAYAEPLQVPVIVIPGADHFFHGRLKMIRDIIEARWHERWPA